TLFASTGVATLTDAFLRPAWDGARLQHLQTISQGHGQQSADAMTVVQCNAGEPDRAKSLLNRGSRPAPGRRCAPTTVEAECRHLRSLQLQVPFGQFVRLRFDPIAKPSTGISHSIASDTIRSSA